MRRMTAWLAICLVLASCNLPSAGPTQRAPLPLPSPTDDLSFYAQDLVAGHEGDLQQLDRPSRYSMTLVYDPSTPSLQGSQDVLYFNRQAVPLSQVYFRLFANYPGADSRIKVAIVKVNGVVVAPVLEAQDTALRVPLATPLAPGASVNAHLEYTVTIPRNSKQHYADLTADESIVTMPSIYPLIPAYDAQGWHIEVPPPYGDLVYADISLFGVTMTVPSTMTVIASGSTIATTDNGNGTKTWKMVGAPMRDFDLNVTDGLQKSSATVGGTTVNSYYEAADGASGKDALKFASDALRIFEERFGDYPYKELDVIETPTTAGGIEYPGAIVIGRSLYSSTQQRQFFEFATAHETAHQWWYAMVGNDQVNYPWVDESLAQYSALIYDETVHGPTAGQSILRDYFQNLYQRAKRDGHDAAVNQPVAAFDEADYSAIVYGKGPLFYDAIRKKMGDPTFFKFLRTYFERYRYKIAVPEDILKTAEEVYGGSLQAEYQQWILSP